ncbi:DUF2690 domain-containing protein [Streptomyces sp. NPDC002769]|uniref:helix-turn-helix domain-containing protein n=1 Tax=Streptomyces sp. NPDC002769 TaxID=3154542 RepID=UPI0033307844
MTVKRQPLPDSLDDAERLDEEHLLLERLRGLRQRTGLSLAALAAVTPFSKSTWHRYLNGEQFPPRSAVESLGRLAQTDPGPLLSLWDAVSRSRCGAVGLPAQALPPRVPSAQGPAPDAPVRGRRVRPPNRAVIALAAVAAATMAVTAAAAEVLDTDLAPAPAASASSCRGHGCQGQFPTSETCGRDARTEAAVARAGEVVLLRFSASCATVWSEVRTRTGGAREISVRAGRDELSAAYPGDPADGYSSPMLAAASPRGAEACAEVAGRFACTAPVGGARH